MGRLSFAESSAYPPGYNFQEVLVEMRRHPIWGEYAQHLMANFVPPKVSPNQVACFVQIALSLDVAMSE
jgi:hypothetical protein